MDTLLESERALGAYDILRRLAETGRSPQPPTVYRALDYLIERGMVHRIERLNAFVACTHPHCRHDPALMVCRRCRGVTEAASGPARAVLDEAASAVGFRVERSVIEAIGLCAACETEPDGQESVA